MAFAYLIKFEQTFSACSCLEPGNDSIVFKEMLQYISEVVSKREVFISHVAIDSVYCFHLTSWWSCSCAVNKKVLIISFVWDTNIAAMSIVFCVSWYCV